MLEAEEWHMFREVKEQGMSVSEMARRKKRCAED